MTNSDISAFGKKLQQLREAKEWTQPDLSYESGVDVSTISRIERGVNDPKLSNVMALARALGCKIDELIKL